MTSRLARPVEPAVTMPWASMLLLGTFGSTSAASRRYHWRCGMALTAWIVGWVVLLTLGARTHSETLRWVLPALTAGVFTYIAFEFWRFVFSLDELARTLQLEAMALTYLIGIPVFVSAHVLSAASGWSWYLPPVAYLGLEIIRGIVLSVLARRYR